MTRGRRSTNGEGEGTHAYGADSFRAEPGDTEEARLEEGAASRAGVAHETLAEVAFRSR